MPATKLDPLFKAKRLEKMIKQKAIEFDFSQDHIAARLNMSYPTYIKKRKSGRWTFDDMNSLFDILDFSDEEKLKVFQ